MRSEQNILFVPSIVFCNTISHFREILKICVEQYPRCAIKLRHCGFVCRCRVSWNTTPMTRWSTCCLWINIHGWGSTSCVPQSRICIICIPRCPLYVYQLRPELSTPNMTSCVPRLVRNCVRRFERYCCTKCPTIGRFLHIFIVFYFIHNYMHAYRIVEWYRQRSGCIMLLSDV